jgi:hypothetical protein
MTRLWESIDEPIVGKYHLSFSLGFIDMIKYIATVLICISTSFCLSAADNKPHKPPENAIFFLAGSDLYSMAVMHHAVSTGIVKDPNFETMLKVGEYIGYVKGVIDMTIGQSIICPPKQLSGNVVNDVVSRHIHNYLMSNNPDTPVPVFSKAGYVVVTEALQKAYPCK